MNATEKTTIIFTTHDMQDIEKVCNRLIIIDAGKKIFDSSIEEIKSRYAQTKTIEMLLEDGTKKQQTFDVKTVITILVYLCIYRALYGEAKEIDGVTFSMVATNFVISLGLSSAFEYNEMFLPDKIHDGSISNEFLKPVNFILRLLSENIGEGVFKIFFNFLPALVITLLYTRLCLPKSILHLLVMMFSVGLGYLILWLISFIVQTWSFWLFSVWGIITIKNVFVKILSGTLLPLWFMPDILETRNKKTGHTGRLKNG